MKERLKRLMKNTIWKYYDFFWLLQGFCTTALYLCIRKLNLFDANFL